MYVYIVYECVCVYCVLVQLLCNCCSRSINSITETVTSDLIGCELCHTGCTVHVSIPNQPIGLMHGIFLILFFRDGEELDELLERQADMIRYLQQHNASLGRRIMELQARTVE